MEPDQDDFAELFQNDKHPSGGLRYILRLVASLISALGKGNCTKPETETRLSLKHRGCHGRIRTNQRDPTARARSRMTMTSPEKMMQFYSDPGSLIKYDFRPKNTAVRNKTAKCSVVDDRPPMLKCIQWNIERGYQLEAIIDMLKRHQADIICLQELDISCERSGFKDVAKEISQALKMNCIYLNEFVEIHSPKRSRRAQGGGIHGNAILSRFDMEGFVIPHSHHPVNWAKDGVRIGEPREGQRAGLAANIYVPGLESPIRCYTLHLEVFCGIFGRLKQFADIMEDAKKHLEAQPYQLIFGDLNTLAHGIARLSPLYCSDRLRWFSIGYSEARWWQYHIFDDESGKRLSRHVPKRLSKRDIEALTNDLFYDPFCLNKDTTLHGYSGLFKGKLDWMLMRGFHTLGKGMDNHDFTASDHKLLYTIVRPCSGSDQEELQEDIRKAYHEGRILINHSRNYFVSLLNTAILLLILGALAIHLILR